MGVLAKVVQFYQDPPQAPSVSLEVRMPQLPSPPYEPVEGAAEDADGKPRKKAKRSELIPTVPLAVKVGRDYDFITGNVISKVRVEKIWQDDYANTYVILSQQNQGVRQTHAIHISEFKQRVVEGGVQEITI